MCALPSLTLGLESHWGKWVTQGKYSPVPLPVYTVSLLRMQCDHPATMLSLPVAMVSLPQCTVPFWNYRLTRTLSSLGFFIKVFCDCNKKVTKPLLFHLFQNESLLQSYDM